MQEHICGFRHDAMRWLNNPRGWNINDEDGEIEGSRGEFEFGVRSDTLDICAPARKDFWCRTFYSPPLIKRDASAYLTPIKVSNDFTVSLEFQLCPITQFDQVCVCVCIYVCNGAADREGA